MNMMKKTLLVSAVLTALTGCEEDYKGKASVDENVAPTHSGSISATFHEKDGVKRIYLLGTTEGRATGKDDNGTLVATDANGDHLQIQNLQASTDDLTGFEISDGLIVVRPSELVDSLDSGQTKSVTFNYEISDGELSVARSATINIEGEDFAPAFEATLSKVFTKFDSKQTIDLLEGATDDDGETLTVSDFSADATYPAGLFIQTNGTIDIDIPSVADDIAIGENMVLTFSYNVSDHNHTLPRTVSVRIRGVRTEPVAPIVSGVQTSTVNTSGTRATIDLAAEPVVVDENGDALTVDFSSLSPANGAPDLEFAMSSGSNLVFDPSIFGPYVASGATEKFMYNYDVSDGTHTEAASIEITVTNDGLGNLITNGGFEDGLNGWTQATGGVATIANASALGMDVEGSNIVAFAGAETISRKLPDLATDAYYVIEARMKHKDGWGGANLMRVVDSEGSVVANTSTYEHGGGARTNAIAFMGGKGLTFEYEAAQESELDDVRLYKLGVDQGINMITLDNSNFENGAADWVLATGVSVKSDSGVISGTNSLFSGTGGDPRNVYALPNGALSNTHRYMIVMDVNITDFAASNHTFRASVVNASNQDEIVTGHAFEGVFMLAAESQKFVAILDLPRDATKTDWATTDQALHIGTNVWGQGFEYIIDNIQLFQLP
ncbi:hypothetical protein ACMZOO_18165 (plasmid) [Catenovulum sp. SX2]|uniref:hypothetical protein n=1 Tax=Catenovulum sp. SX2 TaxID=3398614 RepID=UPI003F82BD7B